MGYFQSRIDFSITWRNLIYHVLQNDHLVGCTGRKLAFAAPWGNGGLTKCSHHGGRIGLVVRALSFHQCGPGSISALGVIRGLSLLVLYSAMRGFPPGTPVFPSHQKPTFDLV